MQTARGDGSTALGARHKLPFGSHARTNRWVIALKVQRNDDPRACCDVLTVKRAVQPVLGARENASWWVASK